MRDSHINGLTLHPWTLQVALPYEADFVVGLVVVGHAVGGLERRQKDPAAE